VIELRAGGGRGADSEVVERVGINCFAAVMDTLEANFGGSRSRLLEASETMVRFPGERFRATA
jgi:hypothetical protein